MSEESSEVKIKALSLKPTRPFVTRFLKDTFDKQQEVDCLVTDAAECILEGFYNVNPPEPTVIKETIEIPIQLQEGESILKLSPEQRQVLEVIAQKRQKAFKFTELETVETLLLKSFFTKAYLFNHFNEFYTGLERAALEKAEKEAQTVEETKTEEDENA